MDCGHRSERWLGSAGTAHLGHSASVGATCSLLLGSSNNHARAGCSGKTRTAGGQVSPVISNPHSLFVADYLLACVVCVLWRPCCWPNSWLLRKLAQGSPWGSPKREAGGSCVAFYDLSRSHVASLFSHSIRNGPQRMARFREGGHRPHFWWEEGLLCVCFTATPCPCGACAQE